MKNDKTGIGGRMDDFEIVIVKPEKKDSKKSEKDQKKKP